MANKTIYELTENQNLDADDLFEQDVLQNNERKSLKATLRAIADKIITSLTYSSLNTTSKTISGAINELEQGGGGSPWTELSDTLSAGTTTLTLQDSSITTNSVIDYYTSVFGVNPTNIVVTTGQIVLTFEAQQSALGVKVRIS